MGSTLGLTSVSTLAFMQIFFTYDKKQVIQALRYHFIGRYEVRILIVLVNVFAIFSAAMFYFHKVSPLAFLLSSILWMALMITFWFVLPGSVYKRTTTFKDAFKMTITEQQVRIENDRGHTSWDWGKFSNYIETPYFIHLYFDSKSFFLIPKKAVEETSNLSDLRKLLEEKIKNRK